MTSTIKCFAVIDGLPVYGERAKINNVKINDIISYMVKGHLTYSVVTGTTSTMIKIQDLLCENTEYGINLYVKSEQNSTTKNLLKETRKILKIKNIKYL
jgi:hypothetical protein